MDTLGYLVVEHLCTFPRDERSKLDSKPRSVFSWVTKPVSSVIGCGIQLRRRLVRSRDVVFFEEETIENVNNLDNTKTSSRNFVDLTPISRQPRTETNQNPQAEQPR